MNALDSINEFLREGLFLPEQASTFARKADFLHYFIILTTFFVAVIIGAVGLTFLIRYRRRAPREVTPHIVAPWWLEALFVGIPLFFFLLWFVIGFRDYAWARQAPADAMDVYVSAKQWMWQFSYTNGASSIGTLRVPAGRPVRLLMSSRDVIHSFFVPDFRLKMDVIPARYTELWFEAKAPGVHALECAEYCGTEHSKMLGEVQVLAPAEFDTWLHAQQGGEKFSQDSAPPRQPGDLAARGRVVAANKGCLRCHTLDGTPHIGPTWRGLYRQQVRLQNGAAVLADEAYLTESMMDPPVKVVAGFPPVMPSFFGQLEPAEVGALVELIKSISPPKARAEAAP